jgi:Fic family protein
MAELSGAGQLLPNPHLLIRPYLWREAILSSRIENTIAEVQELALFDVQGADEKPNRSDVLEVFNYVRAMQIGLQRLESIPICSRLICELHEILLGNVRGGESSKTPGEYRKSQNWIGRPGATLQEATFIPPPPDEMQRALGAWEDYLNGESEEPVLVKAAILHYQFEAIHPFLDGNGRIGRLLITLFLCSRGCLSQPLLYLSGFFDETRDDYYRLLQAVSTQGRWREWLEYFLRGVRQQARAALMGTQKVLQVYQGYRDKLKKAKRPPQSAGLILDELFGNPIFSASHYCARTNQSFHNVNKGVVFWQKEGLLREFTGQKRNRRFVASELLDELTKSIPSNVPQSQLEKRTTNSL